MPRFIKRLVVLVAILAALVFGAKLILPLLVSKDQAVAAIKTGLTQAGFETVELGTPDVAVGGRITLSFPKLVVRSANGPLTEANVEGLRVALPLSALWSAPKVSALEGDKVTVSLREAPARLTDLAMLPTAAVLPFTVRFEDLTLHAPGMDKPLLEKAHGAIEPDELGGTGVEMAGLLNGVDSTLSYQQRMADPTKQNIKASFTSAPLELGFDGEKQIGGNALIHGLLTAKGADMVAMNAALQLAPAKTEEPKKDEAKPEAAATDAAKPAEPAPPAVPAEVGKNVSFQGQLFVQGQQFVLKEIKLTSPVLSLDGELGSSIAAPYNLQGNLHFTTLDTGVLTADSAAAPILNLVKGATDGHANAKLLLRADQVTGAIRAKNLTTLVEMKDGQAKLGQTSLEGDGETRLGFEGNLSQTAQGPALVGRITAEGKSFKAFLPNVSTMPVTLPDKGFGPFALAADIRLSGEDLRLSDVKAKIEGLVLNAAFIEQFNSRDIGLRIALSGLDADALLSGQAEAGMKFLRARGSQGGTQTQVLPPYVQEVLLGLKASYNIYLYLENYTWDGLPRDPLEMRLKVARGRIDLEQFKTRLNGAEVAFSGMVDVTTSVPKLNLDLTFGDLDLGRFQDWLSGEAKPAEQPTPSANAAPGSRWSNAPLNWNFIPLADGQITLKADRILHPALTLSNAAMEFKLANEQLSLEKASARVFNADLTARGNVTGGALPLWQLSFTLANLEIAEMGRLFPWMQRVQGRVSLSGAAASSGASALAQIRNLKASLAMNGRGVQMNEFDLSGAVEMLRKIPSVDILAAELDRVLPLSNTRFDSLEGTINIESGQIYIPRLLLSSPRFVGMVEGKGSVVDWQLEARTRFPLSVLRAANPPELALIAKGPLDQLTVTRNDANLAQYVTEKTAAELIQGK